MAVGGYYLELMAMEMELEGVAVKSFKEKILNLEVHFYVVRLKQSFVLWIGTEPCFDVLSVAMPTRFVSIIGIH